MAGLMENGTGGDGLKYDGMWGGNVLGRGIS